MSSVEIKTLEEVVNTGNFVVLDTETTGLHDGEIVQIAIVHATGSILMDTLVKPVNPIPEDARRIHGISDAMVANAPGFAEVAPQIQAILQNQNVIVYNAVYDRKMLHKSAEYARIPKIEWKSFSQWFCAMEAYAIYWGDWNDWHKSFSWQKLEHACKQQRLPVQNAHSALGDCLMTLALCNKVWRQS